MVTTIQVDEKLKMHLDKLKLYNRESYNDLLLRLIGGNSPANVERESLVETIEILSNPEMMRGIAKGIEEYNQGKFKTLEQIKKELGSK